MNVGDTSSQGIRDEFMQLLLAQLRNQDPLDPISQPEFLGQLAQFSTLEGIESLNARFGDLLTLQQLTQGASLIGSKAQYYPDSSSDGLVEGKIESASVQDGGLVLSIDGESVPIGRVAGVLADANVSHISGVNQAA